MSRLHERAGAALSNFHTQLPSSDSELAQQLTRDPYILDFLDVAEPVAERDLEDALMRRLQDFLLELRHGFAFVGRQWRFEVDGDEFYIDLLFFHIPQGRYVVVELKVGGFSLSTPASLASTSPGSMPTFATATVMPPPSGYCCAPAATTASCAIRWRAPVRRWRSPTTPTTRCPPPSSSWSPARPSSPRRPTPPSRTWPTPSRPRQMKDDESSP